MSQINFGNLPLLYNPFSFNKEYNYMNYSFNNNNSLENTQESGSLSSSDEKNYYYENFGDNYYESLQKGIKDISNIFNNNKRNRPKVSLLCNYYCNLDRTPEEEMYMNIEIQRLSESLKKLFDNNNSLNKDNNIEKEIENKQRTENISNI